MQQGRNSCKYAEVRLDNQIIRKLDSMKRRILARKKVYELQEKKRIHACMLLGGLGDQDPNDCDDEKCKTAGDLNVHVSTRCSSGNTDGEDLPATCHALCVPAATLCSSEEDDACHDTIVTIMGEKIQRRWIAPLRVQRSRPLRL